MDELIAEFGLGHDAALPCPVHRSEEHHALLCARIVAHYDGDELGPEPRGAIFRCSCTTPTPCADRTHATVPGMTAPRPWPRRLSGYLGSG